MPKRDRNRRPARREAFKDPKPLILVICEGAATEPEYLRGFRAACRNPRVEIRVEGGKGAPKTLVEYAKSLKVARDKQAKKEGDDNLAYDQVWCVFDIDQHPNVAEARQMATANGILLAISNPCIELWLLLHFREQPGMQDRVVLQGMMKQFIPSYTKHVNYADYAAGYSDAARRARQLESSASADNDAGRNPTTGVWRLTENIRGDSDN
jgi:hypothetical protein